jgi:hypothetical protein
MLSFYAASIHTFSVLIVRGKGNGGCGGGGVHPIPAFQVLSALQIAYVSLICSPPPSPPLSGMSPNCGGGGGEVWQILDSHPLFPPAGCRQMGKCVFCSHLSYVNSGWFLAPCLVTVQSFMYVYLRRTLCVELTCRNSLDLGASLRVLLLNRIFFTWWLCTSSLLPNRPPLPGKNSPLKGQCRVKKTCSCRIR